MDVAFWDESSGAGATLWAISLYCFQTPAFLRPACGDLAGSSPDNYPLPFSSGEGRLSKIETQSSLRFHLSLLGETLAPGTPAAFCGHLCSRVFVFFVFFFLLCQLLLTGQSLSGFRDGQMSASFPPTLSRRAYPLDTAWSHWERPSCFLEPSSFSLSPSLLLLTSTSCSLHSALSPGRAEFLPAHVPAGRGHPCVISPLFSSLPASLFPTPSMEQSFKTASLKKKILQNTGTIKDIIPTEGPRDNFLICIFAQCWQSCFPNSCIKYSPPQVCV